MRQAKVAVAMWSIGGVVSAEVHEAAGAERFMLQGVSPSIVAMLDTVLQRVFAIVQVFFFLTICSTQVRPLGMIAPREFNPGSPAVIVFAMVVPLLQTVLFAFIPSFQMVLTGVEMVVQAVLLAITEIVESLCLLAATIAQPVIVVGTSGGRDDREKDECHHGDQEVLQGLHDGAFLEVRGSSATR
jgi:hypothetical protein